jgi:hypothetical protein
MTKAWLLLAVGLGACSTAPPLVDMTDIDPVVYQRDLDSCEAQSRSMNEAGPIIAGAIMGASVGAGIGAFAGFAPLAGPTAAEGYGAAAGGVAGAGASAATSEPLAAPPPVPQQTVAECLKSHGYKLLPAAEDKS